MQITYYNFFQGGFICLNINFSRKKAIYDIYMKGEPVENIMLLTGFSRTTIDNIIKGMSKTKTFSSRWNQTVHALRCRTGRI